MIKIISVVKNTIDIRSLNKKKIIEYLRYNDLSTKKDISYELNLSFATISNLCNQLVDEGILAISSSESSSGGRIPNLFFINPMSKYSICFNLTDSATAQIAIVNLKNEIISYNKFEVPEIKHIDKLIKIYYEKYCKIMDDCKLDYKKVLGIGVAAPGIFDGKNQTLINSTNPIFEGKRLKSKFEKIFKVPTYIENESNLMALATSIYGSNKVQNKDIIYLYLGEGLGMGVISNGKLVVGSHGFGGEISHIPIGNRKYTCYCGNDNCVETELTIVGFLRKYYEDRGEKLNLTQADWNEYIDRLIANDKIAMGVAEENGRLIGKLLSIIINIFDPEAIYIGGITEKTFDYLYPSIMEEINKRIVSKELSNIKVYNSVGYANLIFKGCGELVFGKWMP